ncbi:MULTISPECIES: hypothetical protein [Kribbella]|uniref:Uncharacterized protein n=1 Tax=Kribbella sancticallisti TaxID=460087 RepID=A0ABN2EDR6_9ACTN|nr:hypothetical protein [Kribbella catacumbae]
MKLLRILTIPAAALLAVTAAAAALPAQASHSWGTYHWSRSGQVTAPLISSVTSNWSGNLTVAKDDWNASPYIQSGVVAGSTSTSTRSSCPMATGQIRVCNYTYGNNGWAGLASINLSGGHISRGSVKLNDTYESGAPAAERQGVMCQEVGHTYGLAHQDENFNNPNLGTCMDYTNNWGTNQHPNSHDFNQLASIYSHSDKAAAASGTKGVTTIKTGSTVTMITWAK